MTDREKLVNLMRDLAREITCWGGEMLYLLNPEKLADHLIAHGVTVRQMQKPLAYSKVFHSQCLEPQWWVELENGDIFCSRDEVGMFSLDSYGKTWRCWAEKPTDEERMAAELLKGENTNG